MVNWLKFTHFYSRNLSTSWILCVCYIYYRWQQRRAKSERVEEVIYCLLSNSNNGIDSRKISCNFLINYSLKNPSSKIWNFMQNKILWGHSNVTFHEKNELVPGNWSGMNISQNCRVPPELVTRPWVLKRQSTDCSGEMCSK